MDAKSESLWENDEFSVITLKNPHIPPEEGLHIIITPKRNVPHTWGDIGDRIMPRALELVPKLYLSNDPG